MTHTRIIIDVKGGAAHIDVQGGAVQSVYGDLLPDGVNVEIILRDHDNIEAGDPDPMPEDYKPATYYCYW